MPPQYYEYIQQLHNQIATLQQMLGQKNYPAQQPEQKAQTFDPRGKQKENDQFVVIAVQDVDEIKNTKISPLYIYLFIDYSTGNIHYKKMEDDGSIVTYVYAVQEQEQQLNPIEQINMRLANIEGFLGGMNGNQPVSGNQQGAEIREEPGEDNNAGVHQQADGGMETARPGAVPKNRKDDRRQG